MNLPDTVAFLTWLSQVDGRIQITDPEIEVWQHTLSVIPTPNAKDAALEFYRISDEKKPTPHTIRKLAYDLRDRAAAKQSALTAAPVVRHPNTYRQRNPDLWDQLFREGQETRLANLRAKGIAA